MTRRLVFSLLAMLLSLELLAAPHPRPRRPYRRPVPSRTARPHHHVGDTFRKIPWQLVLAGGAAASSLVFAYKVGDGLRQGAVESAKTAPETYIESLGLVAVCATAFLLMAIAYALWRTRRTRGQILPTTANPPNPHTDTSKPSP